MIRSHIELGEKVSKGVGESSGSFYDKLMKEKAQAYSLTSRTAIDSLDRDMQNFVESDMRDNRRSGEALRDQLAILKHIARGSRAFLLKLRRQRAHS